MSWGLGGDLTVDLAPEVGNLMQMMPYNHAIYQIICREG